MAHYNVETKEIKLKHYIKDFTNWKPIEYNIPTYSKETHIHSGYIFEELENKVVAHAVVRELTEEEKEERLEMLSEAAAEID